MTTQEILDKKPLSLSEVKAKIEQVKERDTELSFRANKVNDYLANYSLLSVEDAEKLFAELAELDISRVREAQIKKIMDFLPETEEDLKAIMNSYGISLSEENKKKILTTVGNYAPKL